MSEPMTILKEDWYADDLGAARHTGMTFLDLDLVLSETMTAGRGRGRRQLR